MRAAGIAFALGLAACSSSKTKPPPELGDCVPPPGGACATPSIGGGSSSAGNLDSSTPDGSSAGAGVCGDAGSLVITMNTTCQPCIVANCCTNQICSGGCALLLQQAQACQGDTFCLTMAELTYPSGVVTAYRDFASCLVSFCFPGCPMLPQLP